MNPADELKDLLVSAGVGTFAATSGWSIHVGMMPDDNSTPDTVIALANSGGTPSNPKFLLDFPHVQVRIRGAANGYVAAYDKAVQAFDVLLGLASQDVTNGRIDSITAIGHINPLGFDEKRRPEFTFNLALIVEPNASAETNRVAL